MTLMKTHGFMHTSSPGALTMVPSGYIVLVFLISDEACTGLRWSFTLPVISPTAKITIADVLASWPSMRSEQVLSKLMSVLD